MMDTGTNSANRQLADSLLPHLYRACKGHLSSVNWFRADWQRGGAATGRARWKTASGEEREVMVKFPIRARELLWMQRLQQPRDEDLEIVPHLYASGSSLESYDLAWIVIEWLPYGPLGKRWHADHILRTCEAATRLHAAADAFPVDHERARRENWKDLLHQARQSIQRNHIRQETSWCRLLDEVDEARAHMVEIWRSRETDHWIHGDLHLANALSRVGRERGPVTLIDLAEVRPGHWVEDAAYLERRLWARPERLAQAPPVATMADCRRAQGLRVEKGFERLADIRRLLMAATAPAFMKTEGHPRHLEACRKQMEAVLDRLGRI